MMRLLCHHKHSLKVNSVEITSSRKNKLHLQTKSNALRKAVTQQIAHISKKCFLDKKLLLN